MNGSHAPARDPSGIEATLRDALRRADSTRRAASDTLRRLLPPEARTLLSDEIVARVRGMSADIARQLVTLQDETAGAAGKDGKAGDRASSLARVLTADEGFLAHLHALAIEYVVGEAIGERAQVGAGASPLLLALAQGGDEVLAPDATAAMDAQAHFIVQQRRMAHPVTELPREVFETVMKIFAEHASGEPGGAESVAACRSAYDEPRTRIGLLARLVLRTGSHAHGSLDLGQAGLAMFASTLALATGQARSVVVMALAQRPLTRLAVSLRAAGLKGGELAQQLLILDPDAAMPEGVAELGADRAAAALATAVHGEGAR